MTAYKDPENTILIQLKGGTVAIELMTEIAPLHSARMKELARAGLYDNVAFHRVIEGFMAQTGDVANANMEKDYNPRAAGSGGSELPNVKAEFSKLPHDRGTIGAARSSNPDSANSQFFFNFKDNHFLNGQYTVYGQVIAGMEFVDAIARGEPPANPDRMISVKVAVDPEGTRQELDVPAAPVAAVVESAPEAVETESAPAAPETESASEAPDADSATEAAEADSAAEATEAESANEAPQAEAVDETPGADGADGSPDADSTDEDKEKNDQ